MVNALDVLTEHRNQLNAQIKDLAEKNMTALLNHAPITERRVFAKQSEELENQLNAVDEEIKQVKQEQIRLQEEKRKADQLAATQAKLEQELQEKKKKKAQWTGAESKLKGDDKLAANAEKILDVLKVQVIPSTECVEPNDAFIKALFRFGTNSFKRALQGTRFKVKEKCKTHKKDAVFSQLKFSNADGYEDDNPLSEFDRAVLGVIISEYLAGNRYTTVNIIHRALIGKVGDQNVRPFKNQQDAIINSVIKLMATVVDFSGAAESLIQMKYTDKNGNEVTLKSSNLISADILDGKINGQIMKGIIFFKDNSPLFDIADAKKQIIRYPHSLLDVPNQNNTPRIISIKKYVIRRICEIKLHKMTPTITFDDVFSKCRMLDSPRKTRMDARNAISHLFQYLKVKNFISDFELVQQHNKFIAVKFTF